MKLINTIEVDNTLEQIQLLHGDLTDIPSHFAVHLLVISAFPNDYIPTPTSLIGALHRKGVNVDSLARKKDRDLRANFHAGCHLEFRRLLVVYDLSEYFALSHSTEENGRSCQRHFSCSRTDSRRAF